MLSPLNFSYSTTISLIILISFFSIFGSINQTFFRSVALIWNETFMLQYNVWNLVTGSLVETNAIRYVLSVVGVAFYGPKAENFIGSVYLAVYLLFVSLFCGVVTSVAIFVLYVITREEYLLSIEVHGSLGVIVLLMMASVKHNPSTKVANFGPFNRWNLRSVPMLLVVVSGLSYLTLQQKISPDFPFVCVSFYFSWAYLRFIHPIDAFIGFNDSNLTYGDITEDFQLEKFFPKHIQRLVKPLFDFSYNVALLMGFFKGRVNREKNEQLNDASSLLLTDGENSNYLKNKSKDPIVSRRRAKAMKLLDERFAELSAAEEGLWDEVGNDGIDAEEKKPDEIVNDINDDWGIELEEDNRKALT
mmetsp:Transcript_6453/g.9688  ORF Transcript_6453/g.9688 Transcript_6453/m.9688 type:complete len:360 (-) Transcript_6453:34-1113(-)